MKSLIYFEIKLTQLYWGPHFILQDHWAHITRKTSNLPSIHSFIVPITQTHSFTHSSHVNPQLPPTQTIMTEHDKPKSSSGYPPQPPSQSQPFPVPPPQYGTFQGVSNFPPPNPGPYPTVGFPHPVPPPGSDPSAPPPPYYPHGYQAFPGTFPFLFRVYFVYFIFSLKIEKLNFLGL